MLVYYLLSLEEFKNRFCGGVFWRLFGVWLGFLVGMVFGWLFFRYIVGYRIGFMVYIEVREREWRSR